MLHGPVRFRLKSLSFSSLALLSAISFPFILSYLKKYFSFPFAVKIYITFAAMLTDTFKVKMYNPKKKKKLGTFFLQEITRPYKPLCP